MNKSKIRNKMPFVSKAIASGRYLIVACHSENGRVLCNWEMKTFPTADLPVAERLINIELDRAIKKGPTDD